MSPLLLETLKKNFAPIITKESFRREAFHTQERLCATLRYLTSGNSHVSLAVNYRISQTLIGRIITETCYALWAVLCNDECLDLP